MAHLLANQRQRIFTVFIAITNPITLRVMPACASTAINSAFDPTSPQRFTGMDKDSDHAAMRCWVNGSGRRYSRKIHAHA